MASYRFFVYLSISVLSTTRLTYAIVDQQELMHNIHTINMHDTLLSESVVQMLCQVSNKEKFTIARIILERTDDQTRQTLYLYLKELIMHSFQPRELYIQKTLSLTCWRQWINTQKSSQGNYYQTMPDDIHRLFECYTLPQSLEHYTNLNKSIYKYFEIDPVRRYARSQPVSDKEITALEVELQELRYKLYESLKRELLDNYGIILTAEPVKSWYNCIFNAHLTLDARAAQKLQDYIDRQLRNF